MMFKTIIVSGDCPECQELTMLVNIYENIFRCVNCGEDTEQKVNGVIKYMKMSKNVKMTLEQDIDG
jgi:Zn ribbon nucleic-acid-binding protein